MIVLVQSHRWQPWPQAMHNITLMVVNYYYGRGMGRCIVIIVMLVCSLKLCSSEQHILTCCQSWLVYNIKRKTCINLSNFLYSRICLERSLWVQPTFWFKATWSELVVVYNKHYLLFKATCLTGQNEWPGKTGLTVCLRINLAMSFWQVPMHVEVKYRF